MYKLIFPSDFGFKLSRRKHLPLVKAFDGEYRADQFLRLLWNTRRWKRVYENDDYLEVKTDKYEIRLIREPNSHYKSPSYTRSFFNHYWEWKQQYAPPFSLLGKTVLDVGSGCGETPLIWFELGASKVICVDSNPYACYHLRENADHNNWNVEIHHDLFNEKHLKLDWDFAKIDCEGGENFIMFNSVALPKKPIVLETHSALLTYYFLSRLFNCFQVLNRENGAITHGILRNYSKDLELKMKISEVKAQYG